MNRDNLVVYNTLRYFMPRQACLGLRMLNQSIEGNNMRHNCTGVSHEKTCYIILFKIFIDAGNSSFMHSWI